jgi:DNA-binding XRE family transcriptional regulator
MRLQELGQAIREARRAHSLTQARLASTAGISRETLNLLESGLVRDLGIRKVAAVLKQLGLALAIEPVARTRRPDYLRMACTTANVSFKNALTEDQLVHALVTGKLPASRAAHFRALFDEAPISLLRGLANEASKWARPGKLERNLERLVRESGAARKIETWLTSG